ncbi:DNA cytosine methyltransferase [Paraburkholderia sediminicola]
MPPATTYGSVCSGIEAATVAWEPLGMKAAWFSEIEAYPSAVLKHHYPSVPNLGDMRLITRAILTGEVKAPDVLVGGTPCQAFSLAGLREALDDERGQLTLTYMRLLDAIDFIRARSGLPPCIAVWENVPGVLSTKDNAFGCFLAGLAGEEVPLVAPGKKWAHAGFVHGPKRTVAWRTLDAQYLGLAQQRKRVFVVASARKGFDPSSVLFEFDGVRRDSAPSRESQAHVAALTANGVGTCGADDNQAQAGHLIASAHIADGREVSIADTLTTGNTRHVDEKTLLIASTGDVSHCLNAGGMGRIDYETETFITEVAPTVTSGVERPRGDGGDPLVLAFQDRFRGDDGRGYGRVPPVSVEHIGTLETVKQWNVCVTGEITHTLKAEGFDASEDGTGRGQPIVPVAQEVADTLTSSWHNSNGATAGNNPGVINPIIHGLRVRRLMPIECERLQGFPDGYTLVPHRGKPAADGPRYKAIGNSMAVPVMHWIGQRIQQYLNNELGRGFL